MDVTKKLRLFSVNFPFRTESVAQEPSLDTTTALFDFDVAVIRPHTLMSFIRDGLDGSGQQRWIRTGRDYNQVKSVLTDKNDDLSRLMTQGGLLVVILDVLETYKFQPGRHSYNPGDLYTVTNYDFLSKRFHLSIQNGSGTGTQIIDQSEPFSKVLASSRVKWTAFLSSIPEYPFNNPRVFAKNASDCFVGAVNQVGAGHLVFLPNFESLGEDAFLEACSEYRFRREGTPPPNWVESIFLPGQKEAIEKISCIENELSQLGERKGQALKDRDDLLQYKKLLYEKGKTQLEPAVRKALDDLGFQTTPAEIIGGKFEIDGRTQIGPGVLEVKGSKGQIAFDEFSPFVVKLLEDSKHSGVQSKGILVGNGFCQEPPAKRLGEGVFSPHVLDAAKTHSVVLVNSVELYCVLCGLLGGDIRDAEPIRNAIVTTNGYADLRSFCPKLLFEAK